MKKQLVYGALLTLFSSFAFSASYVYHQRLPTSVLSSQSISTGAASSSIVVPPNTLMLKDSTWPDAMLGQPYSYDMKPLLLPFNGVQLSSDQIEWWVDNLPAGLSIDWATGVVSGTPTEAVPSKVLTGWAWTLPDYANEAQNTYLLTVVDPSIRALSATSSDNLFNVANGFCSGGNTSVKCWGYTIVNGDSGSNINNVATSYSNYVGASSISDACKVVGGSVWCTGRNSGGMLGTSNANESYIATGWEQVVGITDAVKVVVSGKTNCALLASGSVACWGSGAYGKLGNGTTPLVQPTPVLASLIFNAKDVIGSPDGFCSILGNGEVYCWGRNMSMGLGLPVKDESYSVPTKFNATNEAVAKLSLTRSGGEALSNGCVLTESGKVLCYGAMGVGVTGPAANSSTNIGREISQANGAKDIVISSQTACALMADGTVKCWGDNTYGQLGIGSTTVSYLETPMTVIGLSDVIKLTAARSTFCAQKLDGSIHCWGDGGLGQLGDRKSVSWNTQSPVPTLVVESAN